jgi:hypothetical protein
MLERLSGITFVASLCLLGILSYFCTNTTIGYCAVIILVCAVTQSIITLSLSLEKETLNKFSFSLLFILTFFEEVVGRWLFVGILPQHLPGEAVFYILCISGNLIVCWIHQHYTSNTHKSTEILPLFISGLVYTYIFIQYGFLASYLCHLAVNSVLLSADKIENYKKDKDWALTYLAAGVYMVCVCFVDLITNSGQSSIFVTIIKGYLSAAPVLERTFWEYFAASSCAIYGLRFLFSIARFDQGCVTSEGLKEQVPTAKELIASIIGIFVLVVGLIVGLSVFEIPIIVQSLCVALFVSFLYNASSGSARVRNFWLTFLSAFIILSGIQSMAGLDGVYTIWPLPGVQREIHFTQSFFAIVYLVLHGLIQIPFLILERK